MERRLVVFDLDGTLIDSIGAHAESWAFAFERLGLAKVGRESLINLIGLPGDAIVRSVLGELGLQYYNRIRWLKDRHFLKQVAIGRVRLYPDTVLCLNHLKNRGYLLGIATSTPNYVLLPLLEKLGIVDYFDYTVGGDEVRRGKPSPDIFLRVVEKAGVHPEETMVVGDTVYDTAPAREVGMTSILVTRGRRIVIENLFASLVVRDLADLTTLL